MSETKDKPSGTPIRDKYAQILELPLPQAERIKRGLWPGATWGDAIALETVKAAAGGNVQAMREIRESIDGKAIPRIPEPADNKITVRIIEVGGRRTNEDGTPFVPRSYESITKTIPRRQL
jgi:hypothetical protein